MKKFLKASALALGLVVMGSVSAAAATLSIMGGTSASIPSNFDLFSTTGLTTSDTVIRFDNSNFDDDPESGLYIDGNATVTYSFLGSEAGFQNWTFDNLAGGEANEILDNKDNAVFDNEQVTYTSTVSGPELLPFSFGTSGSGGSTNDPDDAKLAANGSIEAPLYMALYYIDPNNVIALFGDGTGDDDYDDFAVLISTNNRITPVPLPAPLFLLLSGLLGLGFLGRLKAKSALRS